MRTEEKKRLRALRRKEYAWETAWAEYLRKTPREKWSAEDIEYDGLTEDEDAEYRQLLQNPVHTVADFVITLFS